MLSFFNKTLSVAMILSLGSIASFATDKSCPEILSDVTSIKLDVNKSGVVSLETINLGVTDATLDATLDIQSGQTLTGQVIGVSNTDFSQGAFGFLKTDKGEVVRFHIDKRPPGVSLHDSEVRKAGIIYRQT